MASTLTEHSRSERDLLKLIYSEIISEIQSDGQVDEDDVLRFILTYKEEVRNYIDTYERYQKKDGYDYE